MSNDNNDFSFETLTDYVFENWKCPKKKAGNVLLKLAVETNTLFKLKCVEAVNTYTGETGYVGVQYAPNGSTALCVFENDLYKTSVQVFKDIVYKAIINKFDMNCRNNIKSGTYTYNIKHGNEFIELIKSMHDDIVTLCSNNSIEPYKELRLIPKDIAGNNIVINENEDIDDWFNEYLLCGANPNNDGKIILNIQKSDDIDLSKPFYNAVTVIAALIWEKLMPIAYDYQEKFGEVDAIAVLDYKPNIEKPMTYIRANCNNINTLVKVIAIATERCNEPKYKILKFKAFASSITENNSLDDAFDKIHLWDFYMKSAIANILYEFSDY